MARTIFDIQLMDQLTGRALTGAGGRVFVAVSGLTTKKSLLTPGTLATLTNPMVPTRGRINFIVDGVSPYEVLVDLYGISASGHAFVVRNVTAGTPSEIWLETARREQVLIIPFAASDTTATTETDTLFDLVTGMQVRPFPMVYVSALHAAKTIDFGLLSSESGGAAAGFVSAVSLAALGNIKPTFATTVTQGSLLKVTATGAAAVIPESYTVGATAVSVTYTLSSGTTTAAGYLQIPYVLPASL